MDISAKLTEEFNLKPEHVHNVLTLLDEGNTIPFIARYRKEMTGAIDDQVLRNLNDRYEYLKNLEKLLEYYNSVKDKMETLTKLLDGREIMEILNIKAGPKLGVIIEALKEAQIEGIVKTKDDAVEFIKNLSNKMLYVNAILEEEKEKKLQEEMMSSQAPAKSSVFLIQDDVKEDAIESKTLVKEATPYKKLSDFENVIDDFSNFNMKILFKILLEDEKYSVFQILTRFDP